MENQKTLVEEAVKKDEWLARFPFLEFQDVGYSGSTSQRPALMKLLRLVQEGKVAAVVVKDVSRLSRDHLFLAACRRQMFPQKKTVLISITEGYDSRKEGAEEWMLLQGLVHQWYGQDVGAKMRALRQKNTKAGIHWGRAPYGYCKTKEGFLICEKEAQVVRQLFAWQKEGLTTGEMAEKLQKNGVDTPKKGGQWTAAKVRRLLQAPCYGGTLVLGRWEKPFYFSKQQRQKPEESWVVKEGVFPVLAQGNRYPAKKTGQKHQVTEHPLRGRVRCGGCKKPMVRRWGSYRSFTCPRRAQGSPCPAGTLREDVVLEALCQMEELLSFIKYGETKQERQRRQAAYAAQFQKTWRKEEASFGWLRTVEYEERGRFRLLLRKNWRQWV